MPPITSPKGSGSPTAAIGVLIAGVFVLVATASSAAADEFFRRTQFQRGDANTDIAFDIGDAIFTLNYLFDPSSPEAECLEAVDSNDDDGVDVSDAVFTLLALFGGGQTPEAPRPGECGADIGTGYLGCDTYEFCPDDTELIVHALNRITFGPTEQLLTDIQTRDDLVDYINSQLDDVPLDYTPAIHEPQLNAKLAPLDIGFRQWDTANDQVGRLKGMLMEVALGSEWQLLHVITQFWNNHFHSQEDSLRTQFFRNGNRSRQANRGDATIFSAVDTDNSETITETEWETFRNGRMSLRPWYDFGNRTNDGIVTLDEFDRFAIAYWKHGRGFMQHGIACEMELREYNYYRSNCFGQFRTLFEGCAKSVSMLIYLNGFENTDEAPNENYAREYFELQGLGVDHLYTQDDIEELARILTGWKVGWVERAQYSTDDTNFIGHPEADDFPIDGREPASRPFNFPDTVNWEDDTYTWAFIARGADHDWGEKELFNPLYGGVDSLGNPLDGSQTLVIPATTSDSGLRGRAAVVAEMDPVFDHVVGFRDCAKFISTKLIQLLVTEDLAALEKSQAMPSELQTHFDLADLDNSGDIDLTEWEQPIPFVLPNGRPVEIFEKLDADGDGHIASLEYQEPDLLVNAIATWETTNGNIREVLRTILLSEEFLSMKFYRAKVKTPFESIVSAMRALKATPSINHMRDIAKDLSLSGMELFDFPDPTGESELGFDWVHTVGLLGRLQLLNRGVNPATGSDERFDWTPTNFQGRWGLTDAEHTVEFFTEILYGGDILETHKNLATNAYSSAIVGSQTKAAVAFLVSLPQFHKQ